MAGPVSSAPTVRSRRGARSATRWGLGFTLGGTVFAASYAGMRLLSLVRGEPSFGEVVLAASTPFYARCGIAALQAGIVALITGLAFDDERAEAVLRWAPIWMPLVVLPLTLAMVGFP